MNKNFIIEGINNTDDINALSLRLNELEEVTRIKILKTSISFYCAQPDSIQKVLDELEMDYQIKEIVNSKKRVYEGNTKKQKVTFLFTNLEDAEEAKAIEEVLSKYSAFEDVNLDFNNKLLTLNTANNEPINRIRRLCQTVNPEIDVEQWHKPFKSQDIFQEKYLNRFIRIAVLIVFLAIGVVTRDDLTILTRISWFVALAVTMEKTIKYAIRDIKGKQYLTEHTLIILSLCAGWIYGFFDSNVYFEAYLVALIYLLWEGILVRLINLTMERIDRLLNPPTTVHKYIDKNTIEDVDINDIDIDDQIIVRDGERVLLGGKVMAGKANLDTFAIDGNEINEQSKRYQDVSSGTVVLDGEIRLKVTASYESSALSQVIELATNAPLSKSRTAHLVELVSKYYSIGLAIVALICVIIIPFLNPIENGKYIYLGAIMFVMAGSFAYKQGAEFSILSALANAFSRHIIVKENSGLDDINVCKTIIYDRFDGIEMTEEETELFKNIQGLHRDLIIFNDGPTDLENDEFKIYNNLNIEEKLEVMEKAQLVSPVVYVGDCEKDVSLLQKADVAVARGGVHNKKVQNNADILITDSSFDTVFDLFVLSKKQKVTAIENTVVGMTVSLIVVLIALSFATSWAGAFCVYVLEAIFVLLNTHRIIDY
ncbi:MAG: hypothetical protein PHH04_04590 [Thomasclavelia sp.]|nr:hypothetical protein [Thomasclavelia sp.]